MADLLNLGLATLSTEQGGSSDGIAHVSIPAIEWVQEHCKTVIIKMRSGDRFTVTEVHSKWINDWLARTSSTNGVSRAKNADRP